MDKPGFGKFMRDNKALHEILMEDLLIMREFYPSRRDDDLLMYLLMSATLRLPPRKSGDLKHIKLKKD